MTFIEEQIRAMKETASTPRGMRGFTLLEVLIAILVVSIGLLGLAGLQLVSLRNTHSSALRTVATQMAYDMADRIRANPKGLTAGDYNNPAAVPTAGCLGTAGCSPQQMAQMDVYMWNQENNLLLPKGVGVVCIDGTPNDGTPAAPACDNAANAPYVIKVWWLDDRNDPTASYRACGDPRGGCFVTSFRP